MYELKLHHHIYRITREGKDQVVIARADAGVEGYNSEIIASFKSADLRDIALEAFRVHIRMNRKAYPNHYLGDEK